MRIIVIAHNGYPFRNNEHAVLIATGITQQGSSQKTEKIVR